MSTIKNDTTGDSLPAVVLHPGFTGDPPQGLHLPQPSLLFIGLPHVCVHSFAHICALYAWNSMVSICDQLFLFTMED